MRLDEIENELAQRGVEIVPWDMPAGVWGAYDKKSSVVYYDKALTQSQRRVTLLHELIHVRRGDDGHQPDRVERLIDRQVVRMVLSQSDYIRAERLHDCDVAAMAQELDLPVWVIEGYQDHLRQRTYR